MIEKIITIVCDNCGCGIEHYPGCTIKQAEAQFADDKVTVKKGNHHFCNAACLGEFECN